MVWDYSEANAFSAMAGDLLTTLTNQARVLGLFHQVRRLNFLFNKTLDHKNTDRRALFRPIRLTTTT